MLSEHLQFKGHWRPYQEEVLNDLDKYLDDSKIHVVAAPGAGKTVLGIELIRRIGYNAIILVPRISILDQWMNTVAELFSDQPVTSGIISMDIEHPAPIIITTYQALRSLLNAQQLENIRKYNPKTILLDESHHLTEKWNSDTQNLIDKLGIEKTIALTATPPYEVDGRGFNAYFNICGEIDVEISVPELVSYKNLCPHQDFVYTNAPNDAEKTVLKEIYRQQTTALERVVNSPDHTTIIEKSLGLLNSSAASQSLLHPDIYFSLISVAQSKNIKIHPAHLKFLNITPDRIPEFSLPRLEVYLNTIILNNELENIFSDFVNESIPSEIKSLLPKEKFWDNKKLEVMNPPVLRSLLKESGNKIDSIANIIDSEFACLKDSLRLVVLVDRIGDGELLTDEDIKKEGIRKLTAASVFIELTRRSISERISVALVTGRLIIIPKSLKMKLKEFLSSNSKISLEEEFSELEGYPDYFFISGPKKFWSDIVLGCTLSLIRGDLKVIVGTGSLLGEGWDCPSINSLILGSQIGSFVATNQMRGRAIRVDNKDAGKVSNIWHLATMETALDGGGYDFNVLKRRFGTFLGISEKDDIITDGFERMDLALSVENENDTANEVILERSSDRESTAEKWFRVLKQRKKQRVNFSARTDRFNGKLSLTFSNLFLSKGRSGKIFNPMKMLIDVPRMNLDNALIKRFCILVIRALYENNFVSTKPYRIKVTFDKSSGISVSCKNRKDSLTIQKSLSELFQVRENIRYMLVIKRTMVAPIYIIVPTIFSVNKTLSTSFKVAVEKKFGKTELIYAKNEAGRGAVNRALGVMRSGAGAFNVETSRVWS